MILATDNNLCYYNNKQEKEELLKLLNLQNYKVFSNNDIKKATNYAKTEKIYGFKTDEMTPLEIFQDLKDEGIKLASFKTKSGENKIVILNDIYVLNTKKYIDFNPSFIHIVRKVLQGKTPKDVMENITQQIKDYAIYHKIPLDKAAYQYFFNFERNYKQYPWARYDKWNICHSEDLEYLIFEHICEKIFVKDSYSYSYHLDFKKYESNYKIKENDILDIKEVSFPLIFDDPEILKSIEHKF